MARPAAPQAAIGSNNPPAYFDGLNPEQHEAVLTLDGPLLVLAAHRCSQLRGRGVGGRHLLRVGRATSAGDYRRRGFHHSRGVSGGCGAATAGQAARDGLANRAV